MLVTGLVTKELPDEEFIMIAIEVLSIHWYVDPRNKELGYMCCMGNNLPQQISWWLKIITHPTIKKMRKRHSPFEDYDENTIPED